jgi:hypothetical protein
MKKVYVVVDWENSDILGVFKNKSAARNSMKDTEFDVIEGSDYAIEVSEMR